MRVISRLLIQVALIAVLPAGLALAVNAVRSDGLPLVAAPGFVNLIYADCPEADVQARALSFDEFTAQRARYLIVDCRQPEDASASPVADALNVPLDELFPVDAATIQNLREQAKNKPIVVIGPPLDAKALANDLMTGGLKNVAYLEAGFEKLLPVKHVDGDAEAGHE